MPVVYVDTLFLLNLSVDYLLLLLTARITGVFVRRRQLLAGAAIGAVLSVLLYFPPLPWWLMLILRGGTLAATVLPAFRSAPVLLWPRLMGTFLLLTTLLAGAVLALSGEGGPLQMQNGTIYAQLSGAVMVVSFVTVFALTGLVLGKGRAAPCRHWREIRAEQGYGSVTFRVLTDSGNLLRDPVSGRQVIVVEGDTLAPLLGLNPTELSRLLREQAPQRVLERLREACSTAFWLLPVRTVMQKGLMVVFRPEKLYVDGKPREDCLLGITEEAVGAGGDCQGLMGV